MRRMGTHPGLRRSPIQEKQYGAELKMIYWCGEVAEGEGIKVKLDVAHPGRGSHAPHGNQMTRVRECNKKARFLLGRNRAGRTKKKGDQAGSGVRD